MTTSQVKLESIRDHIPLIFDDVALILQKLIHTFQYKSVLEIGTAYGFSAHSMADAGGKIITVERNLERFNKAKLLLSQSNHIDSIEILHQDAKTLKFNANQFDLIFIDGAKSQYQNMFKLLSPFLKSSGMIICDNMYFHHLKKEDVKRHTRQLLRKIEAFHEFLKDHDVFDSHVYDIGDGLSISIHRNNEDIIRTKKMIEMLIHEVKT